MKLWDKGFSTDKKIDLFTVGNDRVLDLILAKYDVMGNLAHAQMLHKIGLLSADELTAIKAELEAITIKINDGTFTIESNFEDVHSKIEFLLTEKLGDTGKKIHTARSRNDQVLVDIHLFVKDALKEIMDETDGLFDLLITLANRYQAVLLPGYTHLQIAMPSSFGLWFSAYAETLIDDLYFVKAAFKMADQNPLGSAAGYGSSFPIDRDFTTKALNFSTLKYNSVAAQMSRGKLEKGVAFALSAVASTLSKMSMDICLYMNQNFAFISFPDELTTGSSIMPHKKNPDVFELIRAKCNKLQALPYEFTLITNNLPSGYHRDLQLLKEGLIPAFSTLKSCLEMLSYSLKNIKVNTAILEDEKYNNLFSVETVNKLVQSGVPFRDAYKMVGKEVAKGQFKPDKTVCHTHIGSIGNLCLQAIVEKKNKA
ncbi:MAG: argininosuccinate lyase [Flavobacteriales bacterium CG03_land_8_20_14_0_80_35_15]|nr:argininosuccinate lyase [Zetaproteobacteria bacterium]OIO12602.1 MAG: argininosuccinate lyase [Flavobacteriaceae bacterium CG1_02_35_72]PIV16061.1 MAG: argininosuccinate lyase [Flavobacteriales bacterium CG03_land_8_20_14_0_80_35_15]PIX07367.1 MAG: argininosuccinate lyase [Flavobacteriales bacterium CG_4_8_14_3_um_filter_35_10]PJA04452.1 MAG: argininosuccinate lyase [Flavobacteriales bacterium CG_4_10_14_0_2_um_filter_35_18]